MSQAETLELTDIRLTLGKKARHVRVFRNHAGVFFAGKLASQKGDVVVLTGAKRVQGGLHDGAADLVGWTEVEITPEMVGKKLAVFTSLEVKTRKSKKKPPQEQIDWRDAIVLAGGIAGIVRTPEEALALVNPP